MSVILNSRSIDVLEKIFIFYDFNQVVDVVMVVAYIDKLGRWEKIFVYNSEDIWHIEKPGFLLLIKRSLTGFLKS